MRRMLFLLMIVVVFGAPLAAQEQRGSIEGTVRDASGAVLPGVTVEAKSPSLVGLASAVSDARGLYRFPALVPGLYEVTATLEGFQTARSSRILLELGQILKVDLTLAMAGVTESVTVTGEAPLIDVKQNASGANVESAIIERVPKGRDFTSVITTAPGISDESRNRGIQVGGGSGADNRFVVDGVDTTNIATGLSTRRVAPDFIKEVQVKATGYNAEYRASIGGVMSVITKTGSDAFHGSAGTYFTNEGLQGAIRPFLRLNPSDQKLAEYVTTPADGWYNNEFVFDLGGPIMKDRLWFYAGYNPSFSRTERTVTFRSARDAGAQTFSQAPREHTWNYNVTGQVSKNVRGKLAVTNLRSRAGFALPSIEADGTSTANPFLFPSLAQNHGFNDSYSGVIDWVVNNHTYVNLTTSYLRYGGHDEGQFFTDVRHVFSGSNFQFPDIPADLQHVSGYSDVQPSNRMVRDTFTRLNVNADISRYITWKGQHTVKAGLQVERLGNDVLSGQMAPQVSLYYGAKYYANDGRILSGKYGYFNISQRFTAGDVTGSDVSFFVQDAWTLNDRLTLNLGFRTERETSPSYTDEPGVEFGFADKLAPRVGFAWDVKGDSRWKVYGSYGMYYDLLKMTLGRVMFGGDKWMNYFYTLDEPDFRKVGNCGYPPASTGTACGGTFIEPFDYRPLANDRSMNLVDPNLKPIRQQEATLGLDHEVSKTISIGASFVHRQVDRAIEAICVIIDNQEYCGVNNPGFGKYGSRPFVDGPAQPKAQRDYDAVDVHLRKRFSDGWSAEASYTLSRLYGNWSGIASSDEAVGSLQPYSGRAFDLLYYSYDANGEPSVGVLATDRPHQFKLRGTYDLPWGTMVGVSFMAMSGTPWGTVMTQNGMTFFPYGRGNLGRTPTSSRVDLLLQQEFRLPRGTRVSVGLNAINVLDQETVTSIYPNAYRDGLNISNPRFFGGFDPAAVATELGLRPDPRYKMASGYAGRRNVQLQAKLTF
ncbi:MAG TPA: TonB-dependent receptor [Vicinamibacterales bacterium]|nr:TonB-dependent receptor [Vicinamibacterales bacterium]